MWVGGTCDRGSVAFEVGVAVVVSGVSLWPR
jgi:hypothetical protein